MTSGATLKVTADEVRGSERCCRVRQNRVLVIRLHRVRVHRGACLGQLRGVQRRHALLAHEVQQQLE